METEHASSEKVGCFSSWWLSISSFIERAISPVKGLAAKVKKIGQEDPRRIFHSLKVGMALTLVSTFYYVTPLFNGFGVSTMWAVLTVVVVMEYTVGGTLAKGLNRAFATLVAGALGLGAHHVAALAGKEGEPIVLGIFVFAIVSQGPICLHKPHQLMGMRSTTPRSDDIAAASATFSRFLPEIKKRYDYGVTIFILTFSMIAVSSYRSNELVQMAHQRLSTIAIGVATCICISIFVCPVWAGEQLHNLEAANLQKLASFLEGFGAYYFGDKNGVEKPENKSFLGVYHSVLHSKFNEESLANFAKWEPGHGRFGFRHPWSQYLKIGSLTRQCAYSADALTAYIVRSEKAQTQSQKPEFPPKIRSACLEMCSESVKALSDVASAIRTSTHPTAVGDHLAAAAAAAVKVQSVLSESDGAAFPAALHGATVASLIGQIVDGAQTTAAAVDELARLARFKAPQKKAEDGVEGPHAVIDVRE